MRNVLLSEILSNLISDNNFKQEFRWKTFLSITSPLYFTFENSKIEKRGVKYLRRKKIKIKSRRERTQKKFNN
jgi:hypothetical protein